MTFIEIMQAVVGRFRAMTIRRVGDYRVLIPAYETRLLFVQAFMDKMEQLHKLKYTERMEIDTELRLLVNDLFLGAVEAIDSCIHARKPLKHRDGIFWAAEVRIRRRGELLFSKLMAFTDTPAGVFFMDVAFPGYAERWKAAEP